MDGHERSGPGDSLRAQRVVVTGAGGQLGAYIIRALSEVGATPIGLGHHPGPGVDIQADVTDATALDRAIAGARPDVVIHAAAMTDVDGCERQAELADQVNHLGARNAAAAASRCGAWLVAVSTDFVFSGTASPYAEDAATNPLSVYGASKLAGEQAILDIGDGFAVARTAWVYGGPGKHFPRSILNLLDNRPTIEVVEDERGNPTFAGDLATALVHLAARRPSGIVHLTNAGTTSRFELARAVAARAGRDPERVQPTTVADFLDKYPLPARRPADSSLVNTRAAALGIILRPWQQAIAEYVPRLAEETPGRSTSPAS